MFVFVVVLMVVCIVLQFDSFYIDDTRLRLAVLQISSWERDGLPKTGDIHCMFVFVVVLMWM